MTSVRFFVSLSDKAVYAQSSGACCSNLSRLAARIKVHLASLLGSHIFISETSHRAGCTHVTRPPRKTQTLALTKASLGTCSYLLLAKQHASLRPRRGRTRKPGLNSLDFTCCVCVFFLFCSGSFAIITLNCEDNLLLDLLSKSPENGYGRPQKQFLNLTVYFESRKMFKYWAAFITTYLV